MELLCLGDSIARCLYTVCQLVPQVLLPLACPLAPFPLPVGHGDEGVAQLLEACMHCSCGPAVLRAVQPTGMAAEKGLPRPCACIVTTVTTYEKSECCLVPGNRQHALYLLQHMFDKTWLRERPAVGSWRTKGNCQRSDLCKRVACSSYVVASSLLPLACPLTSFPLPVGHADESVAHPKQMPSLQQGGTRWRPAREEVRRTINSTAHVPVLLLLSPPFPRLLW